MSRHYFAMDNAFRNSLGEYPLETRCAVLADVGYDGVYLNLDLGSETARADLGRVPGLPREHGLETTAVYTSVDLTDGESRGAARELVETVGGDPLVELALRNPDREPSTPAGDDRAAAFLEELLGVAADRGLEIVLYPHFSFWLERVEDAVRLCERLADPNLGAAFCGYHWYVVDGDGAALADRLAAAAPHLLSANLCGARRRDAEGGLPATIEPLDGGELDNFALLGALRRVGYEGPVGVQSYSIGGDPHAKLERSLGALRDMERRLEAHPERPAIDFE